MPGSNELAPQYDPKAVESGLYRTWMERGAFAPTPGPGRLPYVIVIPPPNVTGVLHMGHGLNNTIQDVLIRFERARGRETLWLPGTDHAGIATQNVVERLIAKEGKTRFDLGRAVFVERVWAFVRETGNTILEQLKQIGASCDWSRTRFTLDPAYTRAVREVFVRLWEEKLIYRGHRVIHWCPRCLTALSDEEAEFKETSGNLYYIHYTLADGTGHITVATTRPETLLGDTAIVVHPDDPRGAPFIGRTVKLPITGIEIPVLADDSVDKEFGTGFVKVTPAHDANDFEIGSRHGLAMPLIMRENATMGDDGGDRQGDATARVPTELVGIDRFEARKKIIKQLEAAGLLAKVETHQHAVRRCYRCDSIVEPRLSDQWFVRMKPLAEPVLAAYHAGEITIVPERWNATFLNWMENIRDWNISRQLWWGHRIPVFTCTQCKHEWADREDRTTCPKCGGPVEQDPDVLDTWFSSWLWPFATLGWPEETADLRRYYPGHTLVTAPEILFFWVARMLMAGFHFMGKKPFTTVYLTGTARDKQHRRMSKSLGNGIDPLDVVKLYGADALRWTLVGSGSLGADVILDPNDLETTFATGRNFANKLWNIARFLLPHLPTEAVPIATLDSRTLTLADRWILSRTEGAVADATAALEQFRLDEAAKRCFEFAWGDLADWYVETVKPRLTAGDASARAASAVLLHAWDTVLRLLHPIVPFITEELWQKLPGRRAGELLITAPWPTPERQRIDARVEAEFGAVQQAITAIRNIRAEYRVSPKTKLAAAIRAAGPAARGVFESERETILRLAQLESVTSDGAALQGAHAVLSDGSEVVVALTGAIDLGQECRRLSDELTRLDKQLQGLAAKLANEQFISRAPADVIERERQKEQGWRTQRDALAGKLAALGCG
ncbi:MAG TPA: valine--tRNA ligase [Gemmatimonadales bacterium]|nr:valine--tRNA ligase [Gemmatimonadales bacterium]